MSTMVFSLLSLGSRVTISKTGPTQKVCVIKCQGTTGHPRRWWQLKGQSSCVLLSIMKLILFTPELSRLLKLSRFLLPPSQPTHVFLRLIDARKTSIALCLTPWNEISPRFKFPLKATPRPQTLLEIPAAQDGLSYGKEAQPKSQSANTS